MNEVKIETLKKIIKLILKQELNSRQKTILELYFVRKLKYFQIAQLLNVSKSTVSRTKKRAFQTVYHVLKYYEFK